MKTFLLRGVPQSLATDGWWLSSSTPPSSPRPRGADPHVVGDSPLWPARVGGLVGLVALSDLLLWQVARPGVSLAVFGAAILLIGWMFAGRRGTAGLMAGMVLMLPAVETVQALSLAFWIAGVVVGAVWIAQARIPGLAAVLRFLIHAPGLVVTDLRHATRGGGPADVQAGLRAGLRAAYMGWFLPLGLGCLFLSLVVSANPIFDTWLDAVMTGPRLPAPERVLFWAGVGILLWPIVSLRFIVHRLSLGFHAPRERGLPQLFNAISVRRSLILFNALFAVQTLSDIAVFSGGASLPDGMSYAQYAHRGAYPLLATALLAGVFALAARPFATGHSDLRAMLLVWMGQTLVLVLSSLLRLETYVSVYGLTHWRLAALIWMGLVAVGVALVIAQILRERSTGWLLKRCAGLAVVTLYACSLTSFAATIARYNLNHDVPLDRHLLCRLDSAALPEIAAYENRRGESLCGMMVVEPKLRQSGDWREWGFRDWRTARSLAAMTPDQEPSWPTY